MRAARSGATTYARLVSRALAALLLLIIAGTAQAHKASTSYLQLAVDNATLSGRWDIALRDLDYVIGLDADGDGALTWAEVRQAQTRIGAYALSRLNVRGDDVNCALRVTNLQIAEHSDGHYAALALAGSCLRAPRKLSLRYDLLFEFDALHRGLLKLDFAGAHSGLFAPDERRLEFAGSGGWFRVFGEYFRAGLFHVWSGLDHLLFLAGLFLPAILRRENGHWVPTQRLRPALRDTTMMVTAFTLAHACTLTLAATGWFSPPSRLVESAVAATVLFAGLNNLLPMVYRELFWLAGVFGLVHGAAVAGALIELGLPAGARVWALLAFNLGVEAAQLSVLLAVIPTCFALRRSPWYPRLVLVPGAAAVSLVGAVWLLERGAGLSLGVPLP